MSYFFRKFFTYYYLHKPTSDLPRYFFLRVCVVYNYIRHGVYTYYTTKKANTYLLDRKSFQVVTAFCKTCIRLVPRIYTLIMLCKVWNSCTFWSKEFLPDMNTSSRSRNSLKRKADSLPNWAKRLYIRKQCYEFSSSSVLYILPKDVMTNIL